MSSNGVPYGKRPKCHLVSRVQERYNSSIKLRHNMWKKTSNCQSDSSLVYSVNEAGCMIKRKSHEDHVLENRMLEALALCNKRV